MSKLNQILFPSNHQFPAILALEDGSVFHGVALGKSGVSSAEVVFNTAMTGYQEILSDPSYADQMVTLTYPHIGNTGTNKADNESSQIYSKGLIVRDYSITASNWRNEMNLDEYLKHFGVVAISDIDTRALTNLLRLNGSMNGCIMSGPDLDEQTAISHAKNFAGLEGKDLAKEVTCSEVYKWDEGVFDLSVNDFKSPKEGTLKVVCYDFGVKHNILRILRDLGCELTIVPAKTSASDVLAMNPDGVFLSNGPGDPAACDYAIAACQDFLAEKLPLFGICLGHQIMALAMGAQTIKMKFGHHGANHPVENCSDKTVLITSQNHNFAVSESVLPDNIEVTHRSLFDGSLQGISHKHQSAYGFQGHPEASPGPHEAKKLFAPFILAMQTAKVKENNHG